ncbi:D-isomer specific 2-hydroxyacid dehydrogenase [Auriscalpium vulgare]|uniref:D-isomer specific 2-hydroxyacid dehydrogenase n=1 Tax=Auriscalpium vulgare TaxID=40419 RepID=A0ACB8RF65_9AGAM|nr:D-isomer specific 2-hydroxyacid dehydrogenase [Auriscalpium vulgare]
MAILRKRADVQVTVWPEDRTCERDWLLSNIAGADGVIVLFTDKINAELLERAGPQLKVVSTMSVGYDHVSLGELYKRKVRLGYTPDVLTDAVADLSVMLALMAGRNGGAGITLVKDGQWPEFAPFFMCGPQLSSSSLAPTRTAGFLGFGRIAQATLKRVAAFGVTHCIYSGNPSSPPDTALEVHLAEDHRLQSVRRVDLDVLARESDVLFVLAPGGEKTYHVIDEKFLRKMRRHSVLVNTARGTLVDSDALAMALREEWIWGAGLDVVEGEPNVGAGHPLVKEPRCVIVPHIGSATWETRVDMATLAAKNLLAGLSAESMPAELDLASRV